MEALITASGLGFLPLLAIGLGLIALEGLLFSFIILWFGVGFLIVALLELFYHVDTFLIQLAIVAVISMLFILLFRKKLLIKFSKQKHSDNFFNEEGYGVVKNGMIFYKGTFWELDGSLNIEDFKEGERVFVSKVRENRAVINHI